MKTSFNIILAYILLIISTFDLIFVLTLRIYWEVNLPLFPRYLFQILFSLYVITAILLYLIRLREGLWFNNIERKNVKFTSRLLFTIDKHNIQMLCLLLGASLMIWCSFTGWQEYVFHYPNLILIEKIGEAFFIAALVSLIFDVAYHASVFGKSVDKIEDALEVLSNQLGYHPYRNDTLEAYKDAKKKNYRHYQLLAHRFGMVEETLRLGRDSSL
jgi:hypothetical protein